MFILQNHYILIGIFCKEFYVKIYHIIHKNVEFRRRINVVKTKKRDDLSVIAENINSGNITKSSL